MIKINEKKRDKIVGIVKPVGRVVVGALIGCLTGSISLVLFKDLKGAAKIGTLAGMLIVGEVIAEKAGDWFDEQVDNTVVLIEGGAEVISTINDCMVEKIYYEQENLA